MSKNISRHNYKKIHCHMSPMQSVGGGWFGNCFTKTKSLLCIVDYYNKFHILKKK